MNNELVQKPKTTKKVPCKKCQGTGKDGNKTCTLCHGTGQVNQLND